MGHRCFAVMMLLTLPVVAGAAVSGTMRDALQVDVNSNAQADPGDTLRYSITLTNPGPGDATGVVLRINLDPNTTFLPGSLTSDILAIDDHYADVLAHTPYQVGSATGLLANDVSPAAAPLSVIGYGAMTTLGGTVQAASDGAFTYLPPPGQAGVTDTFLYLISDGLGHMSMATAELALVGPLVWHVDNTAPAGGNGTMYAPFDTLAAVNAGGDPDGPGDIIYVHTGSAPYDGGLVLEAAQELLGQGTELRILGQLLVPAGGRPTLTRTGGTCLTLSAGRNTVRGLDIAGVTGAAITGAGLSGVYTLGKIDISGISGDGLVLAFQGSGPAHLSISEFSVATSSGRGMAITGDGLQLDADVASVVAGNGMALDITGCVLNATFGRLGCTNPAGRGVRLQNNSGTTRIGLLEIDNTGNIGLSVSSAGTVEVMDSASVINTANAPGLSVSGSVFDGTFMRVSSSATDYGIFMSSAGGSLTILGAGDTADSGGIIDAPTVDGIHLDGLTRVLLRDMRIQQCGQNGLDLSACSNVALENVRIDGTGSHAVTGTGVVGLALSNCEVLNAGDAAGEDALYFSTPGTNNLSGSVEISDTRVESFTNDGLSIENMSGALVLDITRSRFLMSHATLGGSGILVLADGSHAATVHVSDSTFGDLRGDAVMIRSEGTSSVASAVVQDCSVNTGIGAGGGINVGAFGSSAVRASLLARRNTLTGLGGPAFVLLSDQSARVDAILGGDSAGDGNVIDGAASAAFLRADGDGVGSASMVVQLAHNRIDNMVGDAIVALARHGSCALDLSIAANAIGQSGISQLRGLVVDAEDAGLVRMLAEGDWYGTSGVGTSLSTHDTATLHATLRGTTLSTAGPEGLIARTADAGSTLCLNLNAGGAVGTRNQSNGGYRVVRGQQLGPFVGTFLIQGLVGTPPFSDAEAVNRLQGDNTGGATANGGDGWGTGTCQLPIAPSP